ncbi:hypothetical protein BDC45DRAFT_173780 [Circinella umbellata]|nr:hypothetical protein BDC45DRAFT_173780 [Circinella umbellata]
MTMAPIKSGVHSSSSKKLNNVIQELLDTEMVYFQDMQLILDIYKKTPANTTPFQSWEIKAIFANVTSILDFERTLIPLLNNASVQERPVYTLGRVFLEIMHRMDDVYCAYCKRHQDAMNTLQNAQQTRSEVVEFLQLCNNELVGRTTSWDLPSLLIKPVQRVLKYPLLFQEMITLTSPEEHGRLLAAAHGIQQIADHINETKRRKDLVDMIVSGDTKTESRKVHGINKSIARRAYQFKQATGLTKKNAVTQDALFDALYERFEYQRGQGKRFVQDMLDWSEQVKNHCAMIESFASTLNEFYDGSSSWGPISSFSQVSFECIAQEMEIHVENIISGRAEGYFALFEKPAHVIAKRAKKLLDHDRAGNDRQKDDAYIAINTQLVEELPQFLNLIAEYFEILLQEFSSVQCQTYQRLWHEWLRLEMMFSSVQEDADNNCNSSKNNNVGITTTAISTASTPTTQREEQNQSQNQRKTESKEDSNNDIIKEFQQHMQAVQECMGSIYSIQQYRQRQQHHSNRSSLQTNTSSSLSSEESDLLTWEEALLQATGGTSSIRTTATSVTTSSVTGRGNKKHDSGVAESNNNTLSSATTTSGIKDIVIPDSKISTSEGGLGSLFSSDNNSSPQFQCITVQDFSADSQSEDQLTIRKGDLLQIWFPSRPPLLVPSMDDEGDKKDTTPEWWYGRLVDTDSYGWFPGSCCRSI